jgi:diguanylate cyclase (GGDEF)-like protein
MEALEELPIGVVHVDRGDVIRSANPWFAEWAGCTVDQMVGRALGEFLVHTDRDLFPSAVGFGPWMMLDSATQERASIVSRHRTGDCDVLVMTDAAERFRALTELRQRYTLADRTRTRLELLMNSSVAFAAATTERHLAEVLADTSARAYRAEESTVFLQRLDRSPLVAAGTNPLGEHVDVGALLVLTGEGRRVVTVADEASADRLLPGLGSVMREAGVRAFIATSLHHEEFEFGAFVSWFHHERTFDDEAAPLAEALAGQAAQALATLRLQARLAHAALHDEMTGLPNRRLLEADMDQLVARVGCAVLFIDLDGFKEINDRLGHQEGDRVLRETALRLRSALRPDDLVARYGGDEFVVACSIVDPSTVPALAERILSAISDATDGDTPIRASIGVAVAPPGTTIPAEQLIRQADVAMYRAKTAGGNRIEISPHILAR